MAAEAVIDPILQNLKDAGCRNNWHIHHAKKGGGRMKNYTLSFTTCLPYIGYPRSLNALSCISEICK